MRDSGKQLHVAAEIALPRVNRRVKLAMFPNLRTVRLKDKTPTRPARSPSKFHSITKMAREITGVRFFLAFFHASHHSREKQCHATFSCWSVGVLPGPQLWMQTLRTTMT
jgi:hypothetical protein